jgi:hypothetical protein
MRIMSFRMAPVARILAIGYGILGPFIVIFSKLRGAEPFTLPLGVVAPLFHLNFNLNIPMPTQWGYGLLVCLIAAICYAITGWITGAAAVLVFNFISPRVGGIEASVLTSEPIGTEPAL